MNTFQQPLIRFRKNRRGAFSFYILLIVFFISLFSEIICNNAPLIMRYESRTYFPIFKFYPAQLFGEQVSIEADYKKLRNSPSFAKKGNWMLFPPIPYSPNESMEWIHSPPTPPSRENWLGTDDRGRDLLTRVIYGFRNSFLFALVSWVFIVIFAYCTGSIQGLLGGRWDLFGQRAIEIWNALPILYVIVFLLSLFRPSLFLLTLIWVLFGWMGLSSYIRAEVLKVRKMDYIQASRALGASLPRILFNHVLPNVLTPVITFTPFIISASIGSLAALDYLGLGLPPPTASWGELLKQGKENLSSWWVSLFPFLSLFLTLLLLNFVGEATRSAFDARETAS